MADVPIRSIKFWMNAFIPGQIPSYTVVVPAGPHKGKTMIPGPVPFVSDCYLTDQRSFNNQIHAKSRMHAEFSLALTGPTAVLSQWHNCDWTTECDCEDGTVECHKKGAVNRMNFKFKAGAPTSSNGRLIVEMSCAASNPCSPSSRLFGDIDFVGEITIDVPLRSVNFEGKIDAFPAFEAYASINDGAGAKLFHISPPAGNTVRNLPRGASRDISGSVQDSSGDGRLT